VALPPAYFLALYANEREGRKRMEAACYRKKKG
jgi:hypothetical protein